MRTSYRARIIAAVVAGSSIATWQLLIGVREGDSRRIIGFIVAVGLGVLVPAMVWFVRSLPRRELKRRLARDTGPSLFEARIDALALTQLAGRDVNQVSDVVIAVDDRGLHVHLVDSEGGDIAVPFADIAIVEVSADDDPYHGAGMVNFTLRQEPRQLSITLYAPFMWGAFPATPGSTRRFVDTVRARLTPAPSQ